MASKDSDESAKIKDLLFNTNKPLGEVAKELELTVPELHIKIKNLGLEWVKRHHRKLSRGHSALFKMLEKLFPGQEVVLEHPIGERLRLDLYVPAYNLAIEFHGRQHFEFVEHFHGDIYGFRDSQRRDERKVELCKEQGIALVVFRYNDKLNEESVFARILDAIRTGPTKTVVEEPNHSRLRKDNNPYYAKMMDKKREYQKQQYQEMKKRAKQTKDKKK